MVGTVSHFYAASTCKRRKAIGDIDCGGVVSGGITDAVYLARSGGINDIVGRDYYDILEVASLNELWGIVPIGVAGEFPTIQTLRSGRRWG